MMRRCAPPNQAMGGSNSGEGTPDTSMRRVEVEVRRLLWSRPIRALSIRGVTTSSTSVRGSSQWTLSSCCIPSPPHRCYGAFPCCTRCVPSRLWASQSRSWAPRPRALVSMRRSPPLRSPFSRSVWGRFSSGWKVWGDNRRRKSCVALPYSECNDGAPSFSARRRTARSSARSPSWSSASRSTRSGASSSHCP